MKTKNKLTTLETRASNLCQSIRDGLTTSVSVDWVKSREYGQNPRIYHHGEKCTTVSGCGYCKLSAALADVLQYLGNTEEQRLAIARTGGAGVSAVTCALAAAGWSFAPTASGRTYDVYSIARIA
jgi:hypothetical protein